MRKKIRKITGSVLSFALAGAMVMGLSGMTALAAESGEEQTIIVKEEVTGTADTSFDYHIYQITDTATKIESTTDISSSTAVPGAGLSFTIYDSATDEELATETTDEDGGFSLSADEYAAFSVDAQTDWYVHQDVPEEYPLNDATAVGDHGTIVGSIEDQDVYGVVQYEENINPAVDKSALQKEYEEDSALDEADYTPESWTAMAEALANAEKILADPNATQEEVNQALQDLQDAKANLKDAGTDSEPNPDPTPEPDPEPTPEPDPTPEPTPAVDKDALRAEYEADALLEEDNYTPDSWGPFEEAMKQAEDVLNNDDATQEDVNQALEDLQKAKEDLVEVVKVDKTALQAEYDADYTLEESDYTPASWAPFAEAMNQAKAVLDDENATQDEVNEALQNLVDAREALEPLPDMPTVSVTVSSDLTDNTKPYDGENVILTATAEGSDGAALTYQWYLVDPDTEEPQAIAGATESTCTLAGDVSDSGMYICTVTATDEYGNEATASAAITITIEKAAQTIVFTEDAVTASAGDETVENPIDEDLSSYVGELTYVSSEESIATVDENGVVTIHDAGTVTITATAAETDNYAEGSASYTLTIEKEAFAVYSEDDDSLTFYMGKAPAEGDPYNGQTATAVYTGLEELAATGQGEIPWSIHSTSVTDVVIDASFAEAEPISLAYWFYGYAGATFSGLGYVDTSEVTDLKCVFCNCSGATSLDVSGWDTSNVTNMYGMFQGCASVVSLDLSGWDTANVTSMERMFYVNGNSSFVSLGDLSNWDTSNVTSMAYMFDGGEYLTDQDLDLSAWDTKAVTNMTYMFGDCASLTGPDLSKWDTSSVKDMSYMFYRCYALTDLDLSGWDTSANTTLRSMFYNCSGLIETGDLSEWNTASVTSMESMFSGCTNLTDTGELSDWETSANTTASSMFRNCASLTDLDLSGWDMSAVTTTYCMFYGCEGLASVGDLADWDVANVTTMYYMFFNCASLTGSEELEDWNVSGVTNMAHMFENCEGITSFDLSGWDTTNVTSCYAFAFGCPDLAWVKIGEKTSLFTVEWCVEQRYWYDSPVNGTRVSSNYLQNVTEPGQYWSYTEVN